MLPKTPDQPSTLTERRPESQCAPPMACSSRVVLPSTACTLQSRVTPVQRSLQCIPLALRTLVLKPVSCSLRSIGEFSPSLKKRQCGVKASMAEVSNETSKGKVQVYDSEEELAVALAEYAARLSEKYAKERGAFTVVVSGGSLIKSLRKLTEAPYIDSVDWSKWHMFWVDERVVPKDHPDSNYLLAYNGFLSKVPIPPGNVYAINDSLSAEAAADDYETNLKHLVKNKIVETSKTSGFPKFDVMLLGMGPDGHVASLFPGHPLVQESKKWVTFIKDSPKPPPDRITFTFPVINSSAHIALAVVGAGKAGVVHQALGGDGQGSPKLPVAMVSPEGELAWFLDKEAASKL